MRVRRRILVGAIATAALGAAAWKLRHKLGALPEVAYLDVATWDVLVEPDGEGLRIAVSGATLPLLNHRTLFHHPDVRPWFLPLDSSPRTYFACGFLVRTRRDGRTLRPLIAVDVPQESVSPDRDLAVDEAWAERERRLLESLSRDPRVAILPR